MTNKYPDKNRKKGACGVHISMYELAVFERTFENVDIFLFLGVADKSLNVFRTTVIEYLCESSMLAMLTCSTNRLKCVRVPHGPAVCLSHYLQDIKQLHFFTSKITPL